MTILKTLITTCAASLLLAGTAWATPVAASKEGLRTPVTGVALVTKGSRAGNRMQRQRTRLDRCRNMPSRC